ncbi:MAG: hypothetical protein H6824_01290 [Planctomycetaceae bacterium]|nr:hypothetical protein [Planctomycetaceae bacterium]
MFDLRKLIRRCVPAMCAVGLWQASAFAGENSLLLRTYDAPDGTAYGSVSIRSGEKRIVSQPMKFVVLIDTSASQIGEHRELGFSVLDSFLGALADNDQVAVLAVDVKTAAMTDGFQAPADARVTAKERLDQRFPAGATNLLNGLEAAKSLLGDSKASGIVYIGDGMSAAHLIQLDEMRQLTTELRDAKIPVHSFALGSNTDLRLLGTLAQETGGFVMQDRETNQGSQIGQELAEAGHVEVEYPTNVTFGTANLLPAHPLPMRSDRETVYLYEGNVGEGLKLTVEERGAVRSFAVDSPVRAQGNTFLKHMYRNNESVDGLGLGLAADWMVSLAHQGFEDQVARLEMQGQQALAVGNNEEAERIGFELQEIDPNNARSRSLINAAGLAQIQQVAQVEEGSATDDAAPEGPITNDAATIDPARQAPRGASSIDLYVEARAARGARLSQQVEQGLNSADEKFKASPDAGISQLETIRGNIKSAADIDPELRENLLRRVNDRIQQFHTNKEKQAALIAQQLVRSAETEAQRALIDYEIDRDEQLEQMVNRIRALMDDGFHGDFKAFEQAEAGARQIISAYPNSAVGAAEVFTTEAAGQLDKVDRLRQLRADRYLEVLYQVELSHVPYPDEPPIRYPAAEVWQALTEMRAKWKSVDLHQSNENERRIHEALKDTTSLEFPGNPLEDVVEYISSIHNIPIRLDYAALLAEGIGPDTEVKMVISGISLRSALKLLLEDVGGIELTYVIEDEVMKITTQLKADETLQTRVYPVADLVIPVQPLGGGFGGGGGGLGQQGGFGGGGFGQQGGQQGGFGQQGGGFGGGGGGFGQFSVPAEAAPTFDAQSIRNAKKKP